MSESLNTTTLPETKPVDEIGLLLPQLEAILNLIRNDFQDDECLSPLRTINEAVFACNQLTVQLVVNYDRLVDDWVISHVSEKS